MLNRTYVKILSKSVFVRNTFTLQVDPDYSSKNLLSLQSIRLKIYKSQIVEQIGLP